MTIDYPPFASFPNPCIAARLLPLSNQPSAANSNYELDLMTQNQFVDQMVTSFCQHLQSFNNFTPELVEIIDKWQQRITSQINQKKFL